MTDAFGKLERQLQEATRRNASGAGLARSRRGWRRAAVFAGAAVLTATGGAVAATSLVGGPDAKAEGGRIALQAVQDTRSFPACVVPRGRGLRFSDAALAPEIRAALPALATPAPADARRRAVARIGQTPSDAAVLGATLRLIDAGGGIELLAYVQEGVLGFAPRDPAACAAARRDRAARLAEGRSDEVRQAAVRRLDALTDTADSLQSLVVMVQVPGRGSFSGSGTPIRPGQPLRPGLLSGGSIGNRRSVYVGFASPAATRMLVQRRDGGRVRGAAASVPVRDGFYALILPRGTGPVRLREVTAAGVAARSVRVRG